MFSMNFSRTLRLSLLALMLAGAAGFAAADTYHVDIDTSAYAGTGYLDLSFLGYADSDAATATVSNFSGALGSYVELSDDVSGTLGHVATFGNSGGYNDLFQAVTLGGVFSFDVSFSGSFLTGSSSSDTTFAVSLLNDTQTAYLGADQSLVMFDLVSGQGVTPTSYSAIASVSAVPEPSAWLLMAGGLVLVVVAARRRNATSLPLAV